MATDGPTPPPCDPEIFENGTLIGVVASVPSNALENWVKTVAQESGQRVDWHFAGGRGMILALGDINKACEAFNKLTPKLREARPHALIQEAKTYY